MVNFNPAMLPAAILFINHLCGGEYAGFVDACHDAFINHLCGGELISLIGHAKGTFINHLCGGESVHQK